MPKLIFKSVTEVNLYHLGYTLTKSQERHIASKYTVEDYNRKLYSLEMGHESKLEKFELWLARL